jgi:hypothetical protein
LGSQREIDDMQAVEPHKQSAKVLGMGPWERQGLIAAPVLAVGTMDNTVHIMYGRDSTEVPYRTPKFRYPFAGVKLDVDFRSVWTLEVCEL